MRRWMFKWIYWSGLPAVVRWIYQRRRVTIVVYHDIRPEDFRTHLRELTKRYCVISLEEMRQATTQGQWDLLPEYSLVVTLDDGHQGNRALVSVMKEFDIRATIFLCSGIVGTNRHFWWKEVEDNRETVQKLKTMRDFERRSHMQHFGHHDDKEYSNRQALTWSEVREMTEYFDFQAHTIFHPILTRCDEKTGMREVQDCRIELERHLERPIWALAFPNGDHGPRERQWLEIAGYSMGLTLEPGWNDSRTHPMEIRRVPLEDQCSTAEVLVKTSGVWFLLKRALESLVKKGHSRQPQFRQAGTSESCQELSQKGRGV